MKALTTVSLSVRALLRNKVRSLLTTLGVIIGVSAVIVMVALGDGATREITAQIAGLGSNLLVVLPGSRGRGGGFGGTGIGAPLFTLADVDAIRRDCSAVRYAAASNTRVMRAVVGEKNWGTNVFGVTPEFLAIRSWDLARGRALTAEDERRAAKVCLLGETVRDKLFGTQNPLGAEVRFQRLTCEVVGLLAPKGVSTFGMDQDDLALMPFTTLYRRLTGQDRVGAIHVSAVSEQRIDEARKQIESLLRQRRRVPRGEEDDFSVRDMREVTSLLEKVTGILGSLLAGVAAVSLLVGGIGIMNIMLVSVTERTRGIGVRMALGARRRDILRQFLTEAVLLGIFGGIVGVGVGIGASAALAGGLRLPLVFSPTAMLVAFAVSALVGVVFGVFPARKAARLRPIEALRFE